MADPVLSIAEREACLSAFAAGSGMGAKIRPYVNDISPTEDSVLADFTPASTTGLVTAVAVTWSAPYRDITGRTVIAASSKTFIATGGLVAETIFGYVVENSAGTAYLFAYRLDNPVPITAIGDGDTAEAVLPYGA